MAGMTWAVGYEKSGYASGTSRALTPLFLSFSLALSPGFLFYLCEWVNGALVSGSRSWSILAVSSLLSSFTFLVHTHAHTNPHIPFIEMAVHLYSIILCVYFIQFSAIIIWIDLRVSVLLLHWISPRNSHQRQQLKTFPMGVDTVMTLPVHGCICVKITGLSWNDWFTFDSFVVTALDSWSNG